MPENPYPNARIEECYTSHEKEMDADGYLRSATMYYLVFGIATNETDVLAYAKTVVPAQLTHNGRSIDLDTIQINERLTGDIWKIAAQYPARNDNYTDEESQEIPEFSMDITGGTKHITHSKETIGAYSAISGEDAPDYGGAINVDADNHVNGLDIVNCSFSFTEKHYYTNSKMSNEFKRQIASIVGKVNSATFRQWEAGELLFMGATGSRRGKTAKDKWEVVFRFAVSMNATNIPVGTITIPSKNGWDYLWVKYVDDVEENALIKKVRSAYVERVYDYVSFNSLK